MRNFLSLCKTLPIFDQRLPRSLRIFLPGLLLIAASTPSALAQKLVVDGGFANGLTAWRLTGEGSAIASTQDINNSPSSGSALLRNAETIPNSRTHPIDQCLTINMPGEYMIGASARVAPLQATGRAVLSYVLARGSNCESGFTSFGGRFIPAAPTWTSLAFFFRADEVPIQILVRVGVDKPGADGTLEVQVDQIFLEPVFRNGFE